MKVAADISQSMQRVKVGMLGLAAVILLIGLASAIMRTATREPPVGGAGAAKAEVVANITAANAEAEAASEPLAELGVGPSTGNSAAASRR